MGHNQITKIFGQPSVGICKCLDPVSKNVLVRESLSREMGLVVRKLEEEMKRQTLDKEKGIR